MHANAALLVGLPSRTVISPTLQPCVPLCSCFGQTTAVSIKVSLLWAVTQKPCEVCFYSKASGDYMQKGQEAAKCAYKRDIMADIVHWACLRHF